MPTIRPASDRSLLVSFGDQIDEPTSARVHRLLSRLDNESQLAMILGHEMTHVTHRHALSFQRDAQTKQIGDPVAAVAASIKG